MKNFSIFVEGDGDVRFIKHYLKFLSLEDPLLILPENWQENIQKIDGWNTLDSSKGEAHRNLMLRTTRNGGVNLVIFDADTNADARRINLEQIKNKYNLNFEIFLFPNNHDEGALEELLEKLINPQNQCVLDCWKLYEAELSQQQIVWKKPTTPTTPSSKSKIYAYLEALVGTSRSEKNKIKDPNRDFLNTDHWNLKSNSVKNLKDFLLSHLL